MDIECYGLELRVFSSRMDVCDIFSSMNLTICVVMGFWHDIDILDWGITPFFHPWSHLWVCPIGAYPFFPFVSGDCDFSLVIYQHFLVLHRGIPLSFFMMKVFDFWLLRVICWQSLGVILGHTPLLSWLVYQRLHLESPYFALSFVLRHALSV